MNVQAGNFDRRIRLLRIIQTRDANNSVVPTELDLGIVNNLPSGKFWAGRMIFTSSEGVDGMNKIQAQQMVSFEMYYPTGKLVRAKDIVEFNGERYDVSDTEEVGRREAIRIKAVRRQ